MTRLDALKYCFDNIYNIDNNKTLDEVKSVIGEYYLDELAFVNFIGIHYDNLNKLHKIYLTSLGKAYTTDIFNKKYRK